MDAMSDAYNQLLDATIQHLEDLKSRGVRNVAVSTETLRALAQPVKKFRADSDRKPNRANKIRRCRRKPIANRKSEIANRKVRRLRRVAERALACVKCPHLASSRKTVVFGVGSIDAQLMFVGEAPGADEDEQGEPFVGTAGQLLTKIIQATGLSRADVYIANILKCRPTRPAVRRQPQADADEMATCIPYLHEQIDLIRPKVIVALGATAVEGLLGKTLGITKLRGNWQTYRGTPLMPTYHPAYLLRNQAMSEKRKVWEDMLAVMEKLEMPISPKQRNYFLK